MYYGQAPPPGKPPAHGSAGVPGPAGAANTALGQQQAAAWQTYNAQMAMFSQQQQQQAAWQQYYAQQAAVSGSSAMAHAPTAPLPYAPHAPHAPQPMPYYAPAPSFPAQMQNPPLHYSPANGLVQPPQQQPQQPTMSQPPRQEPFYKNRESLDRYSSSDSRQPRSSDDSHRWREFDRQPKRPREEYGSNYPSRGGPPPPSRSYDRDRDRDRDHPPRDYDPRAYDRYNPSAPPPPRSNGPPPPRSYSSRGPPPPSSSRYDPPPPPGGGRVFREYRSSDRYDNRRGGGDYKPPLSRGAGGNGAPVTAPAGYDDLRISRIVEDPWERLLNPPGHRAGAASTSGTGGGRGGVNGSSPAVSAAAVASNPADAGNGSASDPALDSTTPTPVAKEHGNVEEQRHHQQQQRDEAAIDAQDAADDQEEYELANAENKRANDAEGNEQVEELVKLNGAVVFEEEDTTVVETVAAAVGDEQQDEIMLDNAAVDMNSNTAEDSGVADDVAESV
ncbi:hypothetical protein HDU98_002687 [Podochytrium sp. JEL0797]|nr:hypothetical protein HDU98_002687 [Podochytrium sp. JEL0797]